MFDYVREKIEVSRKIKFQEVSKSFEKFRLVALSRSRQPWKQFDVVIDCFAEDKAEILSHCSLVASLQLTRECI